MELYHSEIRLPDGFVAPTERVRLMWTRHADRARYDDRYGFIPKFETLPLSRFEVVEVGMENDSVAKILFRGHFNDKFDVCFVLIPNVRSPWVVKTVWMNERNDIHKTLDTTRYVR